MCTGGYKFFYMREKCNDTQLRWIVHHSIIIGLQQSKHTARKSQIIYACSSTLCMYFNNASSQIKKRRAILEPTSLLVCFALSLFRCCWWVFDWILWRFCVCCCVLDDGHPHTHTQQSGTFSFVLYAYFLHIYSAFMNYVSTRQLAAAGYSITGL